MKIEFYFDFPFGWEIDDVNNDIKDYEDHQPLVQILMAVLYRKLKKQYPDIEFIPINSRFVNDKCCCPAYGTATPVLKNPDTKKFMIISYCDKNQWITKEQGADMPTGGWDLDNCVDVFCWGGLHAEDVSYNPIHLPFEDIVKYTPSCMTTWFKTGHDEIERISKTPNRPRIIPKKPFFRGQGIANFRDYLYKNDTRFEIINECLLAEAFMQELSKFSVNIDLNGGAEISQRTIDSLGLGIALVRPRLLIQFHNKLIPNFHYAAVECDDQSDYKRLADAYIDKFNEVKRDPSYIKFLSENGRKWYEENCTIDSYVRIFSEELINFNKLK